MVIQFLIKVAVSLNWGHRISRLFLALILLLFQNNSFFYSSRDPLIKLAKALEKGYARNNEDLEKAIKDAGKQSLYAQVLAKNYMNVRAASKFFNESKSERKFKTSIGIA